MAAETMRYDTGGMHCSSCPMLIEMTLEELEGVLAVSSDGRTLVTEVTFDADVVSEADIAEALEDVGYTITVASVA